LAGVVFLSGWHGFLAKSQKTFAAAGNTRSEKFWRATNELPFLAAIVMVIAVTTEFLQPLAPFLLRLTLGPRVVLLPSKRSLSALHFRRARPGRRKPAPDYPGAVSAAYHPPAPGPASSLPQSRARGSRTLRENTK
jgi:hypothetical protein